MTDKVTMTINYHLGCIEELIRYTRQVSVDMTGDGDNLIPIATIVYEAREPLEKAKKELEKLRDD